MTNARTYQVEPISVDFLRRVRTTGIDDLGQPVEYFAAQGGEPCRDVLRLAMPGELLILANHSPFSKAGPYREYGPVFVLAEGQADVPPRQSMPIEGEQAYLQNPVALRGYCANERIVSARLSPVADIEKNVVELLDHEAVKVVHIRYGAYGCFACKVTMKNDEDAIF